MSLPFLPGFSFSTSLGKTNFHKPHYLDRYCDMPLEIGMWKPGIGGEKRPCFQWKAPPYTHIPKSSNCIGNSSLPRWIAFDKQVLSFDGFFQETVTEHREGPFRLRKVKIYFFLNDDTLMVVEPRMINSGLNQGTLVKRHRVHKPEPCSHLFYTAEDFNLGSEINIYGRVYKICDCDPFTAAFYKKIGITLKRPVALPNIPFEKEIMQEKDGRKKRPENVEILNSMQFFTRDPYVLRFFCYWDDRPTPFGDIRQFVLNYYLSDDTIEIVEVLAPNSGRDKTPWFLRRSKIPKKPEPLKTMGATAKHSVLNVLGESGWTSRYLMDPLEVGRTYDDFYTDSDLKIGTAINVFNRRFIIHSMDCFTKDYYRKKYGITDFTPACCPHDVSCDFFNKKGQREEVVNHDDDEKNRPICGCCKIDKRVIEGQGNAEFDPMILANPPHCKENNRLKKQIEIYKEKWCHLPPYNGFGTEEDSVGNCLTLHPENLRNDDVVQYLVYDRRALDSNILRFEACLMSSYAPDMDRKFIVLYFRTNNTFKIFEIKVNNSGFTGGTFAFRQRIVKPNQQRFKCDLPDYYGKSDLYLGSVIVYSGFQFILTTADEYTLMFMERNCTEFPQSDWQRCLRKMMPLLENKEIKRDLELVRDRVEMEFEDFKNIVRTYMDKAIDVLGRTKETEAMQLAEHDYLTLARHYNRPRVVTKNLECDLNSLRAELKKGNFESFEEIGYQCRHHDSRDSGFLTKDSLLTVFKAHRLPVHIERIKTVINQMADENEMVNYDEVLKAMNWRCHPVHSLAYTTPAEEVKVKQKERQELVVNFHELYEDLVKLIYPPSC